MNLQMNFTPRTGKDDSKYGTNNIQFGITFAQVETIVCWPGPDGTDATDFLKLAYDQEQGFI